MENKTACWVALKISLNNGSFRIEGENLIHPIEHMDRKFFWTFSPSYMPTVTNPQWDISKAVWTPEALDWFEKTAECRNQ